MDITRVHHVAALTKAVHHHREHMQLILRAAHNAVPPIVDADTAARMLAASHA